MTTGIRASLIATRAQGVIPVLAAVTRLGARASDSGSRAARSAGLGVVKGGTLYPVLTRLEEDGLLTSSWREGDGGPGRKFFAVTAAGRAELLARSERWQMFTERACSLLPVRERTP